MSSTIPNPAAAATAAAGSDAATAPTTSRSSGFKSTRMLTALAVLGVVMLLCLVVAFYDRKMVIAISSDPAPTHVLRVRRPTPGSEIAQKLAFPIDVVNATLLGAANTTTAAATPNERTRQMLRDTPPKPRHPQPGTAARRHSKDNSTSRRGADPATDTAPEDPSDPGPNPHYIPPFRLIQDDLSGKFDNNRWEVTHIVRNDSLREALKEVDGLKNEEVVVVITSTGKKSGVYLRDRIIPSSRTWMRQLFHIYVVLEDTVEMRFTMRHCMRMEARNSSHTYFSCPNEEPLYLLTRKCSSEYYQAGSACCKVDEALTFIGHSQYKVYSQMQFLVHADDDTYFRVDQLMRWLAAVKKANLAHLPVVAGMEPSHHLFHPTPHGGIYGTKGCSEIKSGGWYQPMMLNRAAVEAVKGAAKAYAATQICTAYKISQDAGLGVLFWMFGLYHIYFPLVHLNPGHTGASIFQPHLIAAHGVKHAMHGHWDQPNEDCDQMNETRWQGMRFQQDIAEGCGRQGRDAPTHDKAAMASMYDAWDHYFLHRQGGKAKVGEAGWNEWVYADVGADGRPVLPLEKGGPGGIPMPYTITKPDGPGKVQRVDPTSAKEGTLWAAGAKDQRLPAGPGGERRRRLLRELKDVADSSTSSSSVGKNASAGGESAATGPRRLVIPLIAQLTGYDKTEHAKKHNIKQAFVPFLPSDCDPPGTSSLKGR